MNRAKSTEVKKTLVRNPAKPVPKTITCMPSKGEILEVESACTSQHPNNTVSQNKMMQKVRFNAPEMHSTLKLSKKIDEIVKPRKTKSLSEVDKSKLAVDEKVSRKVNFPYGQPVFKDLIPLTDNEVKVEPFIVARGPAYQKDKEPNLSDFLQERQQKVYYYQPRHSITNLEERKINIPTTSLRLYKVLKINEECT